MVVVNGDVGDEGSDHLRVEQVGKGDGFWRACPPPPWCFIGYGPAGRVTPVVQVAAAAGWVAAEILALRHQVMVLERQLQGQKIRFAPTDRAFLAALLHRLSRDVLCKARLLVRPETMLRWHRDLIASRHARISRSKR